MTEQEKIITEARSWLGTPWHHAAAVKGAGVDCVHLPAAVWSKVYGIKIDPIAAYKKVSGDEEAYTTEWHLHRSELEWVYLDGLKSQGFVEVPKPEVAGLVVSKIGRAFAHSGIIVSWPGEVIQAEALPYGRNMVCLANAEANWWLSGRELKFFSWEAWHVSHL